MSKSLVGLDRPTQDLPADLAYCASCDAMQPRGEGGTCQRCGARLGVLQPLVDPLLGRVLDNRFELRSLLGAGGMGRVYRAWQASVGREVAIKILPPERGADEATAKRFMREVHLASRLAQPNTVAVHDFGRSPEGLLYLVMELLDGEPLSAVLQREKKLEPSRVVRIGLQLCDALEAAHTSGILHRDLKPANIILLKDPPGRDLVKVVDFGLAKLDRATDADRVTRSGVFVGTPAYIAPEVIFDIPETPASDLYSLGVVLFELATGHVPVEASSLAALAERHRARRSVRLPEGLPKGLAAALAGLLEPEVERRMPDAATARRALEQPVTGETPVVIEPTVRVAMVEPTVVHRPKKRFRPAAMLLTLVLVAGLVTWRLASRESEAPMEMRPTSRVMELPSPVQPVVAAPAPPVAAPAPPVATPAAPVAAARPERKAPPRKAPPQQKQRAPGEPEKPSLDFILPE